MVENILIKLRGYRENLTPAEQKITDYILSNISEDTAQLSIHELAKLSGVSDASVLRFCKTMGCEGYRGFVLSLSSALSARDDREGSYTDICPGDNLKSIIQNISFNNEKSINDTLKVIELSEVEKIVKLLCNARKIVFFGMGASGLVCLDAEQKFLRIGKESHAYVDGHSQKIAATLLQDGDVAIFVSYSGETIEILDAIELASKTGAALVAITKCSHNSLVDMADFVINVLSPEVTIRSGAMGSRIAMLNIVDILFAGVASLEYADIRTSLMKTRNALKKAKRR